jgi:hypothetical protein
MKTHVIQLDRHDDVTSVTDKITWSKSNRVLLVWPKRGQVMNRPLDLQLIQRACAGLGADLACVADDNDLLDHAKELGIPVFRSAKVAQRLPWRRQRHKKSFEPRTLLSYSEIERQRNASRLVGWKWTQNIWVRWAAFLIGLSALATFVFVFAPEAKIDLRFESQQHVVELPVWASTELTSANLSGGIPAVPVTVVIEGQDSVETTGTMSIPEQASSGRVQFINLTDQPVIIPSETIVQTVSEPAIQFRTTQEVFLLGKPGATSEGLVSAVQAGSQGNTGAFTIKAVVGSFGTLVAVHNSDAVTGGRDLTTRTASKADVDGLREHLIESLKQNAIKEIEGKLEPGSRLMPQTLAMRKIQDEKQVPAQGLPGDSVNLTLRVEYQAWSIREDDVRMIGRAVLDASLPEGKVAIAQSFSSEDLSQPEMKDGLLRWQVRATELIQSTWDSQTVIRATAGQKVEQARQNLTHLPGLAEPPLVSLSPAWWPLMPLLPGRIQVEVR